MRFKEKDVFHEYIQNKEELSVNNPQEIAKRIKETASIKSIKIKDLLSLSGIKNINAISELSKGQQMSCISLGNIASVLGVSTDYLLGITDNPDISGNYINGYNNVQAIKNGYVAISHDANNKFDIYEDIYKIISELPRSEQFRAIADIIDLLDKKYVK